ncbi:hypothetical protein GCM10025864_17070 [Luteimicrobium album]|uniref:Uncharacterized protein n=1 Tax=Luteimicrobium album TaxID=1054550 RepID=A0ABQ6I1Y5_9MICO|nr:hypothetical protein GCM10025864_17070 [Luteimicrobium album]
MAGVSAALQVREHEPEQFDANRAGLLDHLLARFEQDTGRLPLPTSSGTLGAAEQLVERLREARGEYDGVGRS